MCGIFGYIGSRNIAPDIILDGLKVLEYRGYDSWGIAVQDTSSKKLATEKHTGKIGSSSANLPKSSIGIGHTRWATHGGVTVSNAHPHMDCNHKIAVVHNGIVENYKTLKEELLARGHTFLSDTDTEVIPHLIEDYRKKYPFAEAVKRAFGKCHGLSAIVAMDVSEDVIVAAKTGSPLIVGKNKTEVFIASDASALVDAEFALYLRDLEMVVLSDDTITLYSLKTNKPVKPVWEEIKISKQQDDLGNFSHFMLKEIFEQPEVLMRSVEDKDEIAKLADLLRKHKKIYFIAAGTAYHAALAGVYALASVGISVRLVVASEFGHIMSEIDDKSLVVAFSQSGETIDVIEPLSAAQKQGATIASVVNVKNSTIQRMSDVSVLLYAGAEKAVASTKAYTSKLGVIFSLAYELQQKKTITSFVKTISQEEHRLLDKKSLSRIQKLARTLKSEPYMFAIGRGMSYSSALEAALKIKEVSYAHIEGLPGGELKHGTIALIQKGTPCIVFAPRDNTYDSIMSNAMEIKSRGGCIIGISPVNSDIFDYWIEVKDLGIGSILAQIIPVQLLAYYLALEKGITDPDKPRNLAKSVTVK
ncbi:MAG: glutamine--fructose-6-phosphate transaminase (isomerizing) [Candidatus Levybacteria bacterium]|nr:glutamine--fructose-6-phosphate transaminase (isomerizing) [Candidatus Levybacteria bacterium]